MIDRTHPLSISRQAQLLDISRGAVYYLPKPTSASDLQIMHAMDRIHLDFPFMGSRQLCRALRRQGYQVGRLHVRTLMVKMGIQALVPQPDTSKRILNHKVFPYLLRKLVINRSNQVWALDTSAPCKRGLQPYIRMDRGFVCLTAVVDVFSRHVLAHRTAITLEACHAVEALEEAYARFGKPEIVNTDQGSQFTAQVFVDAVLDRGVKLSMDGQGAWRDNVFVERMWRSVKYEWVYLRAYDSFSAARKDIDWYNDDRPHSSLNDRTPTEVWLESLLPLKEAA
jgi:putative transposase